MASILSIVSKPPIQNQQELYVIAAEVLQDCEKLVSENLT